MSKHFILAFALTVTACAGIEKARADDGDEWRINAGGVSWHSDRAAHYQETNLGVGLEYRRGDWGAMAGAYRNSIDRTSRYALGEWLPIQAGPVRIGAVAGVVTGYHWRDGGPVPVLAPMATTSIGRLGINVLAFPIKEKTSGTGIVVGLQATWRIN